MDSIYEPDLPQWEFNASSDITISGNSIVGLFKEIHSQLTYLRSKSNIVMREKSIPTPSPRPSPAPVSHIHSTISSNVSLSAWENERSKLENRILQLESTMDMKIDSQYGSLNRRLEYCIEDLREELSNKLKTKLDEVNEKFQTKVSGVQHSLSNSVAELRKFTEDHNTELRKLCSDNTEAISIIDAIIHKPKPDVSDAVLTLINDINIKLETNSKISGEAVAQFSDLSTLCNKVQDRQLVLDQRFVAIDSEHSRLMGNMNAMLHEVIGLQEEKIPQIYEKINFLEISKADVKDMSRLDLSGAKDRTGISSLAMEKFSKNLEILQSALNEVSKQTTDMVTKVQNYADKRIDYLALVVSSIAASSNQMKGITRDDSHLHGRDKRHRTSAGVTPLVCLMCHNQVSLTESNTDFDYANGAHNMTISNGTNGIFRGRKDKRSPSPPEVRQTPVHEIPGVTKTGATTSPVKTVRMLAGKDFNDFKSLSHIEDSIEISSDPGLVNGTFPLTAQAAENAMNQPEKPLSPPRLESLLRSPLDPSFSTQNLDYTMKPPISALANTAKKEDRPERDYITATRSLRPSTSTTLEAMKTVGSNLTYSQSTTAIGAAATKRPHSAKRSNDLLTTIPLESTKEEKAFPQSVIDKTISRMKSTSAIPAPNIILDEGTRLNEGLDLEGLQGGKANPTIRPKSALYR